MSCIEIVGTTGAEHTANPVVSEGKMSSKYLRDEGFTNTCSVLKSIRIKI